MRLMMEIQPGLFVPLPKSLTLDEADLLAKTPIRLYGKDGDVRFGKILGITLWDEEKERG